MSQLDSVPSPVIAASTDRTRSWLVAAMAVLLVLLYLVWWSVYARLHLPPERYDQRPPGAVVTKLGAEFTLVSLQQTTQLVDQFKGPQSPSAGAVWVVARMEVTRRTVEQYFNCEVRLIGPDGRQWESQSGITVSRDSEKCVPDEEPLGRTYPIEVIYLVPAEDADELRGIAVTQNNTRRDPVLTPPA